MKYRTYILIIISFIFFSVTYSHGAYSTHNNATITRTFDKVTALPNTPITVTITFTNLEPEALRGFFYTEHIPSVFIVNTSGLTIDGIAPNPGYIFESDSSGDVYPGYTPYRWILELPPSFVENNPISTGYDLQIIYSITYPGVDTFNCDFNEFSWVGYYSTAQLGNKAAFGYSEDAEKQRLLFGQLDIVLPSSVTEGDGVVQGTVSIPGTLKDDLTLSLNSDDINQATVDQTVMIPSGQMSASFDVTIIDDLTFDGSQSVTITASLTGWTTDTAVIDVHDNEQKILTLTLPASATEGDSAIQGTITIPGIMNADLDLSLLSDNVNEATVPSSVTILSGQTSATFNLTIIDDNAFDGIQTATITVSSPGWSGDTGTIDVLDNEQKILTLTLPTTVTEDDGTVQGTITIPGTMDADLNLSLLSDNVNEATVPSIVTILSGQTFATFNVTIIDDNAIDGTQTAHITVSSPGWSGDTGTIDVLDNEQKILTLYLPDYATEGDTTADGMVSILGTLDTDLIVSLSSDDPSEVTVPISVTILAGDTTAFFNLTLVDDATFDGTQTVTIAASCNGWSPGSTNMEVYDRVTRLDIDLMIREFKAGNATQKQVEDLIEYYMEY